MGIPVPIRTSVAHDSSHALGVATFRDLMSAFPSGVTVVTAVDATGRPYGMTCTSLASVSVAPPAVLVCLTPGPTLATILATGSFAVNFLASGGRHAAEIFATPGVSRFDRVPWAPAGPGDLPRLVQHSFAMATCAVLSATPVGDHQIVVGGVDAIEREPGEPLLYGFRRFAQWPLGESADERLRTARPTEFRHEGDV